jgi:hypothetical protein
VSSTRRYAETVRTVPGIFGTTRLEYADRCICASKPLCAAFLSNCVMRLDDQFITQGDDAHAGDAEIALHSKLPAYWRERRWVEEKFGTRRHTRSLHGPLAARGTSKFSWCRRLLVGPAVRANNSDPRAVLHAELAHDLPHMNFDGTFAHPQLARYNFVRVASTQEFEDRLLPRC